MKRGAWIAAAVFAAVWLPASLWSGLAFGRSFRIGAQGRGAVGPLVEGVIQMAFVMLAPALFAALLAFVLVMWRTERAAARR